MRYLKSAAFLFAVLSYCFLPLSAYSTNSYVNGASLYSQNCASCHGSYPGNQENASAHRIANAISGNKGGMSYLSFLTEDQVQAISNYTYTLSMSVPTIPANYTFSLAATPIRNSLATKYRPLGVGDIYGGLFNWQVDLPVMQAAVDVLVGISADFLPGKIFLVKADGSLTDSSLSGLVFWKRATSGNINESLMPNIPTSTFSKGNYTLYLAITPTDNTAVYTIWSTNFTL